MCTTWILDTESLEKKAPFVQNAKIRPPKILALTVSFNPDSETSTPISIGKSTERISSEINFESSGKL